MPGSFTNVRPQETSPAVRSDPVYVAGTRSFAAEVVDIARDAGLVVAGLLAVSDTGPEEVHGLPAVAIDAAPAGPGRAIVGTGDCRRREVVARLLAAGWSPVTLVHPHAELAPTAALGQGVLVSPGVVVGAAAKVGDHVVLGRGALVGHHTTLDAFGTLGPGVNVAGNVHVGEDAFLGMGAVVRDHVTIGAQAVVGMGAVVVADVSPGAKVFGAPAREQAS